MQKRLQSINQLSRQPAIIVKIIWMVLSIAILVAGVSFSVRGHEEDKEGMVMVGLVMIALSFPLSVLLNALVGMALMLLDRRSVSVPDSWTVFVVIWLAFSIVGYWQWFVLVPFLATKARSRRRG